MKPRIIVLLVLLLSLHLFFLMNLRFTAWPEMFSYPYLRNNGFLLYKDMIHPYPPLLTMILSFLYSLFGYKLEVLKVFTWTIILVNDVLVYLITKKLTGQNIFALLTLIFYITIQPFLEGNQLWFDLAIVPFVLSGFLLLTNKKYFQSGVMLALAALIKQTSELYLVFGIVYLVFTKEKIKDVFYFIAGPLALGLGLLLFLISQNSLFEFLNWTLVYPFTFWSKFPGYVQMNLTNNQIVIIVALLAPLALLLHKNSLKLKVSILPFVFLFLSFIMVYPRFSFFHLQLALAFIAILSGYLISRFSTKHVYIFGSIYLVLIAIIIIRPTVISDWRKEPRFWAKADLEFAKIISEAVKPDEKVYLLGQSSLLYVLSNRFPPKPWFDNFGWYLEIPGVQDDIIKRWEINPPSKIILEESITLGNRFDIGVYRPKKIQEWILSNYNRSNYILPYSSLWRKK